MKVNNKIVNILFALIIFSLIFTNIPTYLRMPFISGPLGDKLVFYPTFLGFIYTAYCYYKSKNVTANFFLVKKYVLIYFITVFVSLIIGLYKYPYWDLIINGPVNQIEKLPSLISVLKMLHIYVDIKLLTSVWMIVRNIKGIILDSLYIFGGAYMIYCWYKDDWEQGFRICCLGVLASLVIIFSYSFIEIFYLAGNDWAKNILVKITPYFLVIAEKNSAWGWPPILWFGSQLRSIFAEPSFFGIYSSFCIPFLWYLITKSNFNTKSSYVYILVTYIMTFFLFLTKARTGVALILGQLLLLTLAIFYLRNKEFFKKFIAILTCTVFAFISCNLFISNFIEKRNTPLKNAGSTSVVVSKKSTDGISANLQKNMMKYLDSNLKSIATTNQRSNTPRYAYVKAAIKTGMNNPVLGVGKGLTSAYMPQYFTETELQNSEVRIRIARSNELGVLYAPIPIINEYAQRFAETGILGMIVFYLPVIILLKRLISSLNTSYEYIFFTISLLGVMASGFSTTLNVNYCYPVLLGFGYAMCYGINNKLDNKEFSK